MSAEKREEILGMMIQGKDLALRKIRQDFQEKYGSFWKCPVCGAYLGRGTYAPTRLPHRHTDPYVDDSPMLVGYAPPKA